jgi:hypothetical protein
LGDDVDSFVDTFLANGHVLLLDPAPPPFTIQIPVGIQVPTQGNAAGGITDGDTFVLGDATRTVTFEFDSDGNVLPTSVRVPIGAGTQIAIADAIVGRTDFRHHRQYNGEYCHVRV